MTILLAPHQVLILELYVSSLHVGGRPSYLELYFPTLFLSSIVFVLLGFKRINVTLNLHMIALMIFIVTIGPKM